jgi:ankyrin
LTYNTNIAKILIEHGVDITATGSKGCTPLHLTAEYYNPDVMRLLLQKGAATELADEDGWTPLDLCNAPLTAQILNDHGADIDHIDKKGLTLLHRAVIYEDVELFRTLLKNGASTQVRATSDGLTVLERIEDLATYRLRERFLAIAEDVVP